MLKKYICISFSVVVVSLILGSIIFPAKKPELLSPAPPLQSQSAAAEPQKSLLYYLNASQELLNKARILSSDADQTPEEKQDILDTVKLALEFISKGIAIYPHDDRGYAQRATIYEAVIPINTDSRKMAILDLERAAEINGQNPQHLQRLANLYLQEPDFGNAAKVWYKAYLLSPVDVQVLYNLADALEKSGQGVQSFHYFEKLISLLPENDINFSTLKERQQGLAKLIQNSQPEDLPDQKAAPIGIEELPLEQAAAGNRVIIAAGNDSPQSSQSSALEANAKSGEAILPANETEVTVKTPLVRDDAFIYIKATSETQNKVIYVSAKNPEAGYFKVALDTAVNFEIKFNWWIIN